MVYCGRCETPGNGCGTFGTLSFASGVEKTSAGGVETQSGFEIGPSIQMGGPSSITELLYCYPCCPPDAFINIKEFYNNSLLNYIPDNHKLINVALRNWGAQLRHWRTRDYVNYYADPRVKPYFNAYARPIADYYFDVDTSVLIADKLLLYQFDNERELVVNFLTDLFNIADFVIPKFNSMCVESPPSAGKNFFFDAFVAFYISYGMFGTANKTDNFSWMDGAGKRIVLWNEPNYNRQHIEKMKEILGGDTTRIKVKYQGDQALQGPPTILLTNHRLNICSDPAFADRLCTYRWRAAPFLKDYKKKIHPLFVPLLLKKYKIDVNA